MTGVALILDFLFPFWGGGGLSLISLAIFGLLESSGIDTGSGTTMMYCSKTEVPHSVSVHYCSFGKHDNLLYDVTP